MTASPESSMADFARLIQDGIRHNASGENAPKPFNYYIATGESRQIVNNGSIEIQRLENHYHGTNTDDERSRIVKWLLDDSLEVQDATRPDIHVGADSHVRQQARIFNKAWNSREPESGAWLLEHATFRQWLCEDIHSLWIHGGGMYLPSPPLSCLTSCSRLW